MMAPTYGVSLKELKKLRAIVNGDTPIDSGFSRSRTESAKSEESVIRVTSVKSATSNQSDDLTSPGFRENTAGLALMQLLVSKNAVKTPTSHFVTPFCNMFAKGVKWDQQVMVDALSRTDTVTPEILDDVIFKRLEDNQNGLQSSALLLIEEFVHELRVDNFVDQLKVAKMYYFGDSLLPLSYPSAYQWFAKAAKKSQTGEAQYYLGKLYNSGNGVNKSFAEAVKQLKQSANYGFEDALYELYQVHCDGTRKNHTEAYRWLEKAASAGLVDALYENGEFCYHGRFPQSQDYHKAVRLYEAAAMKGHVQAMHDTAYCYRHGKGTDISTKHAVMWYREAALKGHAAAQSNLGYLLEHGEGFGLPKQIAEAVKWYKEAAEQGNAIAMNNLAFCYRHGRGIEEDMDKAFHWFSKSANLGHLAAQNHLGQCYQLGQGVPIDLDKALYWYRKSADQKHPPALNNLALAFEQGLGVQQNESEAIRLYKEASDLGDMSAQYNLGDWYHHHPRGKDLELAKKYYSLAAAQGDKEAKERLNRLLGR